MLSIRDCLDYCDLTDEDVAIIAEHHDIPDVAAAQIEQACLPMSLGMPGRPRLQRRRACGRHTPVFHPVVLDDTSVGLPLLLEQVHSRASRSCAAQFRGEQFFTRLGFAPTSAEAASP